MAVGVRHELVGFFAGGVQAQGVVHILMDRERHGGVGAIDAGAAGIHQVVDCRGGGSLPGNVRETDDVAVNIGVAGWSIE